MAKTEANKTSFGKIFKEKYPQFWEFSPLWCNTESSEVLNDLTHCFMENWDSHKQAEHLHTHMGQHRSVPTSGCPTWNSNLFSQARKGPLRYIKAPEGGKFTPNLDPQNFSKPMAESDGQQSHCSEVTRERITHFSATHTFTSRSVLIKGCRRRN